MKIMVLDAGEPGVMEGLTGAEKARMLHRAAYKALSDCVRSSCGMTISLPGEETEESGSQKTALSPQKVTGSCREPSLALQKDTMGKPWLPERPDIHVSVSHCRNGYVAAACAMEPEEEDVGIDIEYRFPYRESLAGKILHPNERQWLEGQDEADRSACLNRIWSRKEAYLKCIGTGIRMDLRGVDTTGIGSFPFEFHEKQTPDYTLCVCVKRNGRKTV